MSEKGDLDPDMQHIKDTVKGKKEEEEDNDEKIREDDYYDEPEEEEYYDEPEEVEISEEDGEPLEETRKEESSFEEEIKGKDLPKPPSRRNNKPMAGQEAEKDDSENDEMMIPETKKIEVPDIEKGPLFIKVKKFKKAKNTLQDMHDINDRLRTKMRGLESTLDEDKMNSQEVQDFLKDLEGSMGSIREKVDPEYR